MKIILGVLCFCLSFVSFAQQQAGDLALQFSGNFFSQRFEINNVPSRILGGNIYVKVGKFFTQNLEMGVKPNFFFTPDIKVNNQDPTKNQTTIKTSVGFGMYAAYSFLSANAKFNPYAGAEVNYQPSGDDAFVNLGPYIGVRYFVTERINIDTNANWLINLGSTYGNDIRNSGLNVSPALNINVGVGVVLGKIL
jgi:hypothetical protein